MRLTIILWAAINSAVSAANVYSATRNTRLAQRNAKNAQENLRNHKASISLTDDVMSIARRLTEQQDQ